MATSNKATWENMQSKLMAMGYGANVVVGEPRHEMQSGTVALIPVDGNYDETVLSQPREIHRMNLRMYINWLDEPQDELEFTLDQFRADILEDVCGDFDLGGTIAYIVPDEFSWSYDEYEVETITYRAIDIVIGYRVDERATFVA